MKKNDLISREDAINSVRWGDTYSKVIDRIKALPSAKPRTGNCSEFPTGWIPCNERLPKFDVKVLAYVENKDPEKRFNKDGIYTAELRDKAPVHDPKGEKNVWGIPGFDSEWTVWAWSYFSEPNVIAWMPLPKPYREDGEA